MFNRITLQTQGTSIGICWWTSSYVTIDSRHKPRKWLAWANYQSKSNGCRTRKVTIWASSSSRSKNEKARVEPEAKEETVHEGWTSSRTQLRAAHAMECCWLRRFMQYILIFSLHFHEQRIPWSLHWGFRHCWKVVVSIAFGITLGSRWSQI